MVISFFGSYILLLNVLNNQKLRLFDQSDFAGPFFSWLKGLILYASDPTLEAKTLGIFGIVFSFI